MVGPSEKRRPLRSPSSLGLIKFISIQQMKQKKCFINNPTPKMNPLICDQQTFSPLSILLTKVSRGAISIKDWITVIETGKRNIEAFKLMKYSQKHKMKSEHTCCCGCIMHIHKSLESTKSTSSTTITSFGPEEWRRTKPLWVIIHSEALLYKSSSPLPQLTLQLWLFALVSFWN